MMTIKYAKTTVALMVSLLSGCSAFTRSEFQAPEVEVPASWQTVTSEQAVRIDPWWQVFHDKTLSHYIDEVLAHNSDLALATLTLQRARLELGLNRQDFYPQLSSSTSASTRKPLDGGDRTSSYQTGLSASYDVDLWGRISADVDAAKWRAMATQEDRESTAQSLVATTASLYWQIGYLKQRVALGEQNVRDAEQTLALLQRQYELGAIAQLDVLEGQRSLAGLQAQQRRFQQQLAEASNAFAILFDRPPSNMIEEIPPLPTTLNLPPIRAGVPADLLGRRPDIKAALYQLKAALANQDAADLAYFPTLSLTGSVGSASQALHDLLSNPIGTLGAGLTLPFLQWNRIQINQDIAALDYQSAVIRYRQTLYSAFQDVDNALSARDSYDDQAQTLQTQYEAARQSETLYATRYRYGAISIMEWLNAQENLRNAQAALLENHYSQLVAQVAVYQALGGQDIAPEMSDFSVK